MKRIFDNKNVRYHLFIVSLTLIYGLVATLADFYGSPWSSAKDLVLLVMQAGVVMCATYSLLMLLALCRWVFAVVFPVMMLLTTVMVWFRYTQGVVLTPMIVELCFVNDASMAFTLLSFWLVVVMVLSLVFSAFAVWVRFRFVPSPSVLPNVAVGLLLLLSFTWLIPPFVRPVRQRMPFSFYSCTREFLSQRGVVMAERPPFDHPAVCQTDTLTVVMVIGESLRADHLQLNGYHRATTPLLASDTSVVSLPSVYTDEVFTHTSVPAMLTRADAANPDLAYEERSFIDLFRKAGYRTAWLANQESVKNYVYFMNECDTLVYANSGKSLYVYDKWLDGDLLPLVDDELSRTAPLKLLVLHTIGSHWWYESHYTDGFRLFEPVIDTRIVSSCTDEELVNSYDNTILYTDWFLTRLIARLKDRRALMIYLSDHGESLGEDGFYLHAAEHETLHWPACMVWMSDTYKAAFPAKAAALRRKAGGRHTTGFLFHSILSGAAIETDYVVDSLNVFAYGAE